jgi:RHS repeat-associated protein
MSFCRGFKLFRIAVSTVFFIHLSISTDFWIEPASARYYCGSVWIPQPDPDDVVWLPWQTFCDAAQSMPSHPDRWIIDDYPDTDIENCAEIGAEQDRQRLQQPGCTVSLLGSESRLIYELPIACNGNVNDDYYIGGLIEYYEATFEKACDGYPPTIIVDSSGSKYFVREPVGPDEIIEEKNLGAPQCGLAAGNPINIATGNKYHREQDVSLPGGLKIVRHYNSADVTLRAYGVGWRGSFSRQIELVHTEGFAGASLTLTRDDGEVSYWRIEDSIPVPPPDAKGRLEIVYSENEIAGFSYRVDDVTETYGVDGALLSIETNTGDHLQFSYLGSQLAVVTLPSGRNLSYSYNSDGKVHQISSGGGSTWTYSYDHDGHLTRVTHPDGSFITYHYEDSRFPSALTGETDELGNRIRTWAYDASGRAILSAYGDDQSPTERNTIIYNPDGTTTTTGPLLNSIDHSFEGLHGVARFAGVSGVCDSCSNKTKTVSYDAQGNRDITTDHEGNTTDYDYTPENLIGKVTYAVGTPQQYAISYQWDTTLRKPSRIVRGNKTTSFTYDSRGQVLTRTESDNAAEVNRVWTYRYVEDPGAVEGKLASIDGPRTDVADTTQYEYYLTDHVEGFYRAGDAKSVSNSMGHKVDYLKYDGDGRLLQWSDANGIMTSVTYHPRGWRNSTTTDGDITAFAYDSAGNLTRITQPDGRFVDYEYDEFHRLIATSDSLSNRVEFTLDAEGNRTAEHTYDDNGTLQRQLTRVYDQLNRLDTYVNGNFHETRYVYDNNGNRISSRDANTNITRYEYDANDRLVKTIDAILGETSLGYDEHDNLVRATDPLGNVTQYRYDGLGNLVDRNSPDSGVTEFEYDEAGNRISATDARGIRTEFAYDALNRLTEISYPDTALNASFRYDAGPNGLGRLSLMNDAAGHARYSHDAGGNLSEESREINGAEYLTSYAYNSVGQLTQISYPSGMVIEYTRDAGGRITRIDKMAATETEALVSDIQYQPFGPVRSFRYGNGLSYSAAYDLDYKLSRLQSGTGLDWQLGYDPADNILTITDQNSGQNSQFFGYDGLNRLTMAQGGFGELAFEFDANGNRTRNHNGPLEDPYTYEPESNRLAAREGWAYQRDSAGNRTEQLDTAGHGQLYTYDGRNRLTRTLSRDGSGDRAVGGYEYDGRGQRISKTANGVIVHFIYGPSGELLGEYSSGPEALSREYVYLNGQPVAVITRAVETTTPPGDELILDNGDPGTSSTGSWRVKSNAQDYGADYMFANKADNRSYRWTATPPGARYRVYAWWVDKNNQPENVSYTIRFGAGETDIVAKSQKNGGGRWQLLGSYYSSDGQDYVEVRSESSRFVADAARWVEITDPVETVVESTNFIHFDHLGTARRVTDDNATVIWRWDSSPFGNSGPEADPDGDFVSYTLNLRFPGQYYDAESGLHYNYFRTYDPGIGRFIESDPIGLAGGPNPFSYVENSPLQFIDPFGLIITGEWMSRPQVNIRDYGLTGAAFISPYLDEWGYLKAFRVYGYAAGHVNLDVRCSDSGDCGIREWEIHEKIDVTYRGYKDLGPNMIAAGAGVSGGPLAGAATGVLTLGGSTLTALLGILREVEARGGAKIQWLYSLGPTAICLGAADE